MFFANEQWNNIKALEHFENGYHLGFIYHWLFASSFHVILKKPWIKSPTHLELQFAKELDDDLKNGITDDFGLHELLLQNNNFLREFEQFCTDDNSFIYNFPDLYNFVKTRIYFIIIHQQQVEGFFNKLDLKTHPNMTLSMKQSKLRLSTNKIKKIPLQEIQLH